MAGERREKFYTISARLVFSTIIVVLILALIAGLSIVINRGPIVPLLGIIPLGTSTYTTTISNLGTQQNPYNFINGWQGAGYYDNISSSTIIQPYYIATDAAYIALNAIVVSVGCSPTNTSFACENPYYNYTTGGLTIAIIQKTGYNWTRVSVRFVPAGTIRAESDVPYLSWSPPQAVNVTGGLLNDTLKYVSIPITSGPVAVGTNITGSIWAKYQFLIGGRISYVNMTSAVIVIRQG